MSELGRMRAALKNRPAAPTTRPPTPTPTHEREDNRHAVKGRLPDGANFDVTYSAATKTWTGTLTACGRTFSAVASGVFTLLAILDDKYRDWKRAATAATE